MCISDAEEENGIRGPKAKGVNGGCFRSIRPSQSDDPYYQNVLDGNSEISEFSVLKITTQRYGYFPQMSFEARRDAERLELCISDAEEKMESEGRKPKE